MLQALTEHLLRSQPVLDVREAAGWTHTERAVTPCSCQARQIHNRGAGGERARVSWVCVPALLLTGCVTLGRHAPSLGLHLPICKTKPGILTEEAAQATAHEAWGPRPRPFSSPSSIPSSDVQPFTGKSVGSVRTRGGLGLCFSNHGRGQLRGQMKAGAGGGGHWCQSWGAGTLPSGRAFSASSWKPSR